MRAERYGPLFGGALEQFERDPAGWLALAVLTLGTALSIMFPSWRITLRLAALSVLTLPSRLTAARKSRQSEARLKAAGLDRIERGDAEAWRENRPQWRIEEAPMDFQISQGAGGLQLAAGPGLVVIERMHALLLWEDGRTQVLLERDIRTSFSAHEAVFSGLEDAPWACWIWWHDADGSHGKLLEI